MQGSGHVEAAVIAVLALEADVAGPGIGADALQEGAQRNAAPGADGAPAFDADVAGDLAFLRQRAQPLQRPGGAVGHEAGDFQLPIGSVDLRGVVLGVEAVIGERVGDLAGGVGGRELVGVEQPGLHPVIEAGHSEQRLIHRIIVVEVAAGQHRQGAQRQAAAQQAAAFQLTQLRRDLGCPHAADHVRTSAPGATRLRPVTMLIMVLGTTATSARWTITNSTMPDMARKWTRRDAS